MQINDKVASEWNIKHVRAHCYCASLLRTLYMVCHVMYFKRAHRIEAQQNIELMTFAVTWCANIFVGCSVTHTCPILSIRFQWTKPGVQWSLVEKLNRKYSRVHLSYETGSVNNILRFFERRRVRKYSDGVHWIHWKHNDSDGICGSLVVPWVKTSILHVSWLVL